VFVITAKETIMDIYEIAHALRDIQDQARALDKRIDDWRENVADILAERDDRKARLAEHTAKWGNRPMITLEVK
jgi:hypothetical protein